MVSTTARQSSASSPVRQTTVTTDRLALIAALANASQREVTARALAESMGAEDLVIFTPDPATGVLLPAPGFPQTLADGLKWRDLLVKCSTEGHATARLRYRRNDEAREAAALLGSDQSVLVLLGDAPCEAAAAEVRLLLPLLTATFRGERVAVTAAAQTAVAQQNAQQSRALAESLDRARRELGRALSDVQAARLHFTQFMQHLPGLAWIKDAEGRYVYANDAATRAFNAEPAKLYGKRDQDLFPPHTAQQFSENDRKALASDAGIQVIETLRHPDGTVHYSIVSKFAIPVESAGTLIGGMAIDITERMRAEEALRQSEAQFRQLADALPQIVWTARPDGFIDYYNERWYEFTGFPRGEYGEESWMPILHPDDVQRCLDTYFGCVRTGTPYQIEYRFKDRASGGYRWFLGRAYPVRNAAGEIVQWFGTCTDIDDTKQAEQTTRFLADASAALADIGDYESTLRKVATLAVPFFADWCSVDFRDRDGVVRRIAVTHTDPAKSQRASELSRRYPPRESDPYAISKVLRTGQSDWSPRISDSMLMEMAQNDEHLAALRELELRSYICTPLNTREGTVGVLSFATAESGRIFSATDLAAAEDLAHRAAIAIENANLLAALKETDRRKDEFLAMLAHELRNPLAPIRNAIQLFRSSGNENARLQWATEVVDRQVIQMTRLVDDLLDVSRITRGKIELRRERIALGDVINSAVEASRPLIEKAGHQLTVAVPPEPIYIDADMTRLAQVLLNLLNNAAKYMDPDGRIDLTARRENDSVVIRVADTGIGIPSEMLPHIFDMFTQVDRSLERSEGGLGIGLTLVKRLVEMHGGSVSAHSDGPGRGSEFEVRLPTAQTEKAAEAPPAEAGTERPPSTGRRVLVVDDNRDAADSLAMLLRLLGNEVGTAHDGQEAVEVAAKFQPDVVLLDLGLPKLNGFEAARLIREARGNTVLLIALTGWGQEEDRRRSKEAGFDLHLTKPIKFESLEKILAEYQPDTR